MGFYFPLFKSFRRVKYFFMLFVTLSVLAWIATFSGETVKYGPVNAVSPQTFVKAIGLEDEPNTWTAATKQLKTPALKAKCPEESPLLEGALKLSFKSSLTLNDVESNNKEVTEGVYQPSDCTARQSVAILIPHRGREKHLLYLLDHLHPFLQRQQLHYAIYIIQQAGNLTFNRAKLLNIGYLEALKDYSWECFIFHDVDLVPENDRNLYFCENQPKHLVVGRNATGYKLRYKGYFGGVTALTKEQFLQVNGFSNNYWGWGGEDDDLRVRVELQKMTILRPPAEIARYTMVFHTRDSGNEVNKDRMKLLGQTPLIWKTDGLNSCLYKTISVERQPLYVNVTVDIGKP
ncbi:beta-1,4-galactosyltransferase 4 [Anoplopoma fimbria]|uniref:beta-1,4-galactosyltransferase 4 n=1 Tax=Anoplopoma fimbria TaxID=229290 RepID=UPI0023EDEE44|nr:beta-1,4-galactosyltransferase 4 [Anoplopoma fimbria]XP_054481924.1 beta-1,4-galactosyltransferase 4 [Anoplopoma fimbria]